MNNEELYNEQDCRMVGEWLVSSGDVSFEEEFTNMIYWAKINHATPELLRGALARDGWIFEQDPHGPSVSIVNFNEGKLYSAEWDLDTDPTARHTLWDATVKHVRRKGNET